MALRKSPGYDSIQLFHTFKYFLASLISPYRIIICYNNLFSKPTAEMLTDYTRKVDFLKGLIEAEKLVSVTTCIYISLLIMQEQFTLNFTLLVLLQPSPSEKALANQLLAPGRTPTISSERMSATKTVHMQSKARCTGEMRSELFSTVRWSF